MSEFREANLSDLAEYRKYQRLNKVNARLLLKKHVRFMVITRLGIACKSYDIGILTSDMEFYDFSMKFSQSVTYISNMQQIKITQALSKFRFDDQSEIIIQDTASKFCPLIMYLEIAKHFSNLKISHASMNKIVKRIFYSRKSFGKVAKNISSAWASQCIYKIWDKLVKNRECPFVTKGLDDAYSLISRTERNRRKRVRIFMFYALIRRSVGQKKNKCNNALAEVIPFSSYIKQKNNEVNDEMY